MAGNMELLNAIDELEKERRIGKEELICSIEEAVARAYGKMYANGYTVRVVFDREDGSLHLFRTMSVVEEVEKPESQLSLEDARKIDPFCEYGDTIEYGEIFVDNFNYTAALEARQTILQRIREAEKRIITQEYKEGDVVLATVNSVSEKGVYFEIGRTNAIMPKSELVEEEVSKYTVGTKLRVYICKIDEKKGINIVVSRKRKELVVALMELEIPEIASGLVEIKGIVREAGKRTKVAVASRDPQIDPVGTCVGPHGDRISRVVGELLGTERIDIIRWSMNPDTYVMNALSPANVLYVRLEEREEEVGDVDGIINSGTQKRIRKVAVVYVASNEEMKLAIGKNRGQNVRLAGKLTGWTIDIHVQPEIGDMEEMGEKQESSDEDKAEE